MAKRKERKQRREQGTGSLYLISGCRRWYIQFYVDGKPRREASGTTSKQQAQDLLNQRLAAVSKGEPTVKTKQYRVEQLYQSMLDYYLAAGKPLDVGRRWKHLQPVFGAVLANRITTDQCTQYRLQRKQAGAATATINRELGCLRRMLRLAAQASPPKLAVVPCIKLVKEDNRRTGFVERPQFDALVAALPGEQLWLRLLLELAWTYGWRKGELLALRCRHVDMLNHQLHLDPAMTKNRTGRTVPFKGKLIPLLQAATTGKQPDDYLLTREDGQQRVRDFRKAWHMLCTRAGLGKMLCRVCSTDTGGRKCPKCKVAHYKYHGPSVHDFRRSAARQMRMAGVPQNVVMDMMGHKTPSMFTRYDIINPADRLAALEKLEEQAAAHAQQSNAKVTQIATQQAAQLAEANVQKPQ